MLLYDERTKQHIVERNRKLIQKKRKKRKLFVACLSISKNVYHKSENKWYENNHEIRFLIISAFRTRKELSDHH